MNSFDTFSDSDSESDIVDLARGMASTPPLSGADVDAGIDKMMSTLGENMRANCQVVVINESTLYSPYDMPRLEVADCIKTLIQSPIITSTLPDVRMVFPQVPETVRFKILNDPNCSMSEFSDCIRYIPDTMSFALQAFLHKVVVSDFGGSSSGEGTGVEEVNLNVDTGASISTLSSKELMSELLKAEKPKHKRNQAENLFAESTPVKSVPRPMKKPLNQPGRKKKNLRNRPTQPQQSHPASKNVICGKLASAPKQKRVMKKEQKRVQKQQRKRKHRG